jgi:uncharacterized protein
MRLDRTLAAAEFCLLFLALPLVLAFGVQPDQLPEALLGYFLLGAVLLWITPGFRWRELVVGWGAMDLRYCLGVIVLSAAGLGFLVWWLVPSQAFFLPERLPRLWLLIILFYPWLSALPQELVFRVLFFRRYGHLFPERSFAIAVNAVIFGLAHLVYWNWVAPLLSAIGGAIFAEAYLRRGGFLPAFLVHAACGILVFTLGLGTFFYHGAIIGR